MTTRLLSTKLFRRFISPWRRSFALPPVVILFASLAVAQAPLPDLLTGQRYMKQTQDLSFASVYLNQQNAYNIDVLTFNTANSQIGSSTATTQQTIATTTNVPAYNGLPGSPPVAVKSGRMFDTPNDQFAALVPASSWSFIYYNPPDSSATPARASVLKSMSIGGSTVVPLNLVNWAFVVMGDFRGDGLKEALGVFGGTPDRTNFYVGMAVMGQQPNGNSAPTTDSVTVGPGYYISANSNQPQLFVSSNQNSVTVGDFNGDGRDEIAVLMNDQQTVRFYSVNPNNYAITPMSPAGITLPQQVFRGTLVAGRFYSPNQVDLVAVGVSGGSSTMLFPYISTQGQTAGKFNPQVATPANLPQQPFNTGAPYGFFASAAPLILPGANQTNTFGAEQLVVVSQNNSGEQSLWIGDFLVQPYAFTQLAFTDLGNACTLNMQTGNFDNQDSSGHYNPAVQLATLAQLGGCNDLLDKPVLQILNINVPDNVPTAFGQNNWLTTASGAFPNATGNVNGLAWPTALLLNVSDVQGRSQQLGAPQIVTIPLQIQPEVVLPMPPMQADYVTPPDTSECASNTLDASGRCVAGITFAPTNPNSKIPAFANKFVMDETSTKQTNNTATTSWGLSVKTSIGVKATFNDLESNGSVNIKDTAQALFNQKVSNQTITGSSVSYDVTAETVTGDVLFFSQRDLYVYYYPVLGVKDPLTGNPVYVNFSIPGNLSHFPASDGTLYDWYQPVSEPGNVLSYPWSLSQLKLGFANDLDIQTSEQISCQTIGDVETSFNTTWKNTSSSSQSVGTSAAFSNDVSMSTSAGAGVSGIDGASLNESIDINTSSSLASLNVETNSIASGQGVLETSPGFSNNTGFAYYVGQYIWGQKPPANNTIWDQVLINTNTGNPPYFDRATTGPLFVGFIADPAPSLPGGACSNNSTPAGWGTAYNLPDIGLNHPKRWHWSTSSSSVSFNYPNGTNTPLPATQSSSVNPLVAPFYWMKGFFITPPNASIADAATNIAALNGPNLTLATDGDKVQLTARVYNYSLRDTDDPTLSNPAVKIHVDFYGQQVKNSNVVPGTLFEIGEQILAQPIPGFKSIRYPNLPNWILGSVAFDTTGRAGQDLVFWVVTWLEDVNGNRVSEVPGHGLLATPKQNLTNLLNPSQLSMENYSNNVGVYGVHTQFSIVPASTPSSSLLASAAVPSAKAGARGTKNPSSSASTAGVLQRVRLQGPSAALLDDDVRLNARVNATGGPVDNITVTYYDGKPGKGTLIDTQVVHHIDAEDFYVHGTSFQPRSCGVHNIYVEASNGKSAVTSQNFKLDVTVDPVALIDEMLYRLRGMKLANQYKSPLLLNLRLAKSLYRQGDERRARLALKSFGSSADLTSDAAGTTTRSRLAAMAGEVTTIIGCEKDNDRRY